MSFWSTVKSQLAQRLSEYGHIVVTADDLVLPPKPEMGDLAFGCFRVAKEMGESPAEAAKALAKAFPENDPLVVRATAEGPFLNFTFKTGALAHGIVEDVETRGTSFGASEQGKGETVMLEYASLNTHKEMHVGHLRNLILGASLVRLLRLAGWNVIPASYQGDVGAHVAKCLWWMVKKELGKIGGFTQADIQKVLAAIPETDQTGNHLGALYSESTRQLEEHAEAKEEVSAVLHALEAGDPAWTSLWEKTRQWSFQEFDELFRSLDVMIDRQYLESEVVGEGQKIVDDLIAKGVAKESQGAIVVDLEDKKLSVFLIRKSDGTSLYATKDLALAYLKQREYPSLDRSIILVDSRQSLYFRQLFETLVRMGYPVRTEHVGYEFVTLKSGAMSSREGNIVTYQSFREEVLAKTRAETKARHPEWDAEKIERSAWALAMAGVKFGMLRQDAEKIFTFDAEQALSFEGDTGPYVQYASVRLSSILRKGNAPERNAASCTVLNEPAEKAVALALARFEDVAARAARELRPGLVAQWCVETAQITNAFYRDVKVLDAPEEQKQARFRLVQSARIVLGKGMEILGIPMPEEM